MGSSDDGIKKLIPFKPIIFDIHMEQCISRVTSEADKVPFGDGKHFFYLEKRCKREGMADGFCDTCSSKKAKLIHGKVDEPITEKSHIFDGSWYINAVRTYGEPVADILEKAMEAQKKARGGKSISVAAPKETKAPIAPAEKTKRGRPKKGAVPIAIAIADVEVIQTIPAESMVETMDEPLEVKDVITVVLRPFTHGSSTYWRDEDREKLYKNTGGKKGAYVGRWDSDKICSVPDSDSE